jgi:hypothetical protein
MKPYALWHQDETTEIRSSQMLEELIDELTMQAQKDKMPFSVQIIMNDDSALLITVGSEISHLEFYSASHGPPVVISVGNWDGTENEAFFALHGGEPSTVSKKSCIPIGSARDAVRQYFETGKRPININWTE